MIDFKQYLTKLRADAIKLEKLHKEMINKLPSIANKALDKFNNFLQIDPHLKGFIVRELKNSNTIYTYLGAMQIYFDLKEKVKYSNKQSKEILLGKQHYNILDIKVEENNKIASLGMEYTQCIYSFISIRFYDMSYIYDEAKKLVNRTAKLVFKHIVRELKKDIIYKEYNYLFEQHIKDKKDFEKGMNNSFNGSRYKIDRIYFEDYIPSKGDKEPIFDINVFIEEEGNYSERVYYGPFLVFDEDYIKVNINISEKAAKHRVKDCKDFVEELFNEHIIQGSVFGTKEVFDLEEAIDYEIY